MFCAVPAGLMRCCSHDIVRVAVNGLDRRMDGLHGCRVLGESLSTRALPHYVCINRMQQQPCVPVSNISISVAIIVSNMHAVHASAIVNPQEAGVLEQTPENRQVLSAYKQVLRLSVHSSYTTLLTIAWPTASKLGAHFSSRSLLRLHHIIRAQS